MASLSGDTSLTDLAEAHGYSRSVTYKLSLLQNSKFELIYFAKRCKKEKQAAISGTMESTKTTP